MRSKVLISSTATSREPARAVAELTEPEAQLPPVVERVSVIVN
jgi:hypothetical protein